MDSLGNTVLHLAGFDTIRTVTTAKPIKKDMSVQHKIAKPL